VLGDLGPSHGFPAGEEDAAIRHGRPVPAAGGPGSVRKGPEEIPSPAGDTLPGHLVQVPGVDEVPYIGGYRYRDNNPGFPAEISREFYKHAIPEGIQPGVLIDNLTEEGGESFSFCHLDRPLAEITRIFLGFGAAQARSQSSLSVNSRVAKLRKSWSRSTPIFQSATS